MIWIKVKSLFSAVNSSSQESDHSGDDSPKKRRPAEEPVKRRPSGTLEISPEKHQPEPNTESKAAEKPAKKSTKEQKPAEPVSEPPVLTNQVAKPTKPSEKVSILSLILKV